MKDHHRGIFGVPLAQLSLKRVAWAYGCAPKGSDDERKLLVLLLERARLPYEPIPEPPHA